MLKSLGLALSAVLLLGFASCAQQGAGNANLTTTTASATPATTPPAATPLPGGSPSPTTTPTPVTVTGSNFKWRDDTNGTLVTTVKVGGSVTWKIANPSSTHSLQAVDPTAANGCDKIDDPDKFNSEDLEAGDTVTRTFTKAGTFGYNCGFHGGTPNCKTSTGSGMAGIIKVVP